MRLPRREFLAGAALALSGCAPGLLAPRRPGGTLREELFHLASAPVLDTSSLTEPLVIESMELLRADGEFLVRVRTRDGLEAVAVPNSSRMAEAYPVFLRRVAPHFIGKDARQLESLLEGVYRHRSNYKYQGLVYWCSVAAAEIALLELLGRASGKSIGELFGGIRRKEIPVYRASSNRGNTPEEEVEHLRRLTESIGARALKIRLGGRMSRNRDSLPGRTEALIPMVREAFGADMTLYADSNSSYDVENAIRIGRLMEEHDYAFFEEPCPFDHLWETREVANALDIPVAGGEQEFSMRRFIWAIENRAVDIVQPDLHYFGGFIRSTRVAHMAARAGLPCTVHMSGSGLGYLYTVHFASYTPNPGAHQEYKGEGRVPVHCETASLKCRDGLLEVPTGPGFGVDIDPDYVNRARKIETS